MISREVVISFFNKHLYCVKHGFSVISFKNCVCDIVTSLAYGQLANKAEVKNTLKFFKFYPLLPRLSFKIVNISLLQKPQFLSRVFRVIIMLC